jgi:hypothetical protein
MMERIKSECQLCTSGRTAINIEGNCQTSNLLINHSQFLSINLDVVPTRCRKKVSTYVERNWQISQYTTSADRR